MEVNKNKFTFKIASGVEYSASFRKPNKSYGKNCDGICLSPTVKKPKLLINPHRSPQTVLNTSIHEFAHAHFWDKPEKDVKKFADTMSRFLYNHCGWRLKDDGAWPRQNK